MPEPDPAAIQAAIRTLSEAVRKDFTAEQIASMRGSLDQALALFRDAGMNPSQAALMTLWQSTPTFKELSPFEQALEIIKPGRALAVRASLLMELLA